MEKSWSLLKKSLFLLFDNYNYHLKFFKTVLLCFNNGNNNGNSTIISAGKIAIYHFFAYLAPAK
jgi:hypothetical protein